MFAAITITGKITLFFHWVSPIHCILFNLMTLVLKSLNIKEHLTMDGETSLFSVIHLSLCLDYFALIRQGVLVWLTKPCVWSDGNCEDTRSRRFCCFNSTWCWWYVATDHEARLFEKKSHVTCPPVARSAHAAFYTFHFFQWGEHSRFDVLSKRRIVRSVSSDADNCGMWVI